nr:MAG TPA: hypothetical protein [Bacteriophage sp.]
MSHKSSMLLQFKNKSLAYPLRTGKAHLKQIY